MNISPKTKIAFALLMAISSSGLLSMDSGHQPIEKTQQKELALSERPYPYPLLVQYLLTILPTQKCLSGCLSKLGIILSSFWSYREALSQATNKEREISLLDYPKILPPEISAVITQLLTELVLSEDNLIKLPSRKFFDGGMLATPSLYFSNPTGPKIWSPDGKNILLTNFHKKFQLIDVQSGEAFKEFSIDDQITMEDFIQLNHAEISPDGKTIFVSSPKKVARIWNAQSEEPPYTLCNSDDDKLIKGTCSPSGKTILTNHEEYSYLWDVESKQLLCKFKGNSYFSPDGKTIYTSEFGKGISMWDVDSKKQLTEKPNGDPYSSFVTICSNNTIILVYDGKKLEQHILLLDITSGKSKELKGHTANIRRIISSPDGTIALTCCQKRIALLWDTHSGELLAVLTAQVESAAFSPDSKTILTCCENETTAYLWDSRSGELLDKLEIPALYEPKVSFSPVGKTACIGNQGLETYYWEVGSRYAFKLLTTKLGPLGAWFIAQASKAKKAHDAYSIGKNSFEYRIFKAFPEHVQDYLKNTYSIKINDQPKEEPISFYHDVDGEEVCPLGLIRNYFKGANNT